MQTVQTCNYLTEKLSSSPVPLHYQGYSIVMAEVPDEVTLAFNISGCTHHCKGCHSPYLWDDKTKGKQLQPDYIRLLEEMYPYISCVCFMGGEHNQLELYNACALAKNMFNLKTCIYTGNSWLKDFELFFKYHVLDYIKIGEYKEELGGLNKKGTNQKMYKLYYTPKNELFIDITYKFQKKKE